ncbi:MAG: hypothetical protein KTR22_05245 [Flavobacteriaceae bacterium]|nr:hypothetical protein [Flavobacteriaceae bacterium]
MADTKIIIETLSESSGFSTGRLMGDLMLNYDLVRESAEDLANSVKDVLESSATINQQYTFPSSTIRFLVEEFLEGKEFAVVLERQLKTHKKGEKKKRYISKAQLSKEITEKITSMPEYTDYMEALSVQMELSMQNNDVHKRVDKFLKDYLVKNKDLKAAEATTVLSTLKPSFLLPPNISFKEELLSVDKDVKEKEERFFWQFVRWLADLLRGLVTDEDDGDDPTDTPPPTIFGEEIEDSPWRLRHQGYSLKAIRLTNGPGDDEMKMVGTFRYLNGGGELTPTNEIEFKRNGQHESLNGHVFKELIIKTKSGIYIGTHILREEDLLSEANAKKVGDFIGEAVGDAISEKISEYGAKAIGLLVDLASFGFFGGIAQAAISTAIDQIIGDALDKADEIVTKTLSRRIAAILGPEAFQPIMCYVPLLWLTPNGPTWNVKHGASYRGGHPGTTPELIEGRGFKQAGPRPGTGGQEIVVSAAGGRYTYSFRFSVFPTQ